MGFILFLIVLGTVLRIVATALWAFNDEVKVPTRKDMVRFYLIPFYWMFMLIKLALKKADEREKEDKEGPPNGKVGFL